MKLMTIFTLLNTFKDRAFKIIKKEHNEISIVKKFASLSKNYFPEDAELPTSDLYHYTNFEALKKIITSKKLWITDYRNLNDPSEVKYSFDTITEIIRENLKKTKHSAFWNYFWTAFDKGVKEDTDIFVVSFCQQPDYLPAWRWYANDGAGFSIGFKKSYQHFKAYTGPTDSRLIKFEKIYYLKPNTVNQLTLYLHDLIQETEINLDSSEATSYKNIAESLAIYIVPALSKIKHCAYEEEQESRIYEIGSVSERKIRKFWTQRLNSPQFVKSTARSTINFGVNDISSIWIGPRCNFLNAETEIRKMLNENGYSNAVEIKQSNIPYRNTHDL